MRVLVHKTFLFYFIIIFMGRREEGVQWAGAVGFKKILFEEVGFQMFSEDGKDSIVLVSG